MKYLYMDIIGTIVVIAIITSGIYAISVGSLIVGWVWTMCGVGMLGVAVHDMWRRYK